MERNYFIYVYKINIDNTQYVYVGLTNNPINRHERHKNKGAVCNFCHNKNINFPEMEIIEKDLDRFSAQAKEENWLNYYSCKGFNLLNKAKCGLFIGSLGTINKNKGYENVQVFNETEKHCLHVARQHSLKEDFRKNNPEEYKISELNGWLSSYYWLKDSTPNKKVVYTKNDYKSYIKKHNILSRTALSLSNHSLYKTALKNKWMDEDFIRYKTKQNKTIDSKDVTSENADYALIPSRLNPSLFINKETFKVYKKLKRSIKEVIPHLNYKGLMVIHNIPYHCIIMDILGNDYNVVHYIDGNFSNISLDNLEFRTIDMNSFIPIREFSHAFINKEGQIYLSKDKVFMRTFVHDDIEYTNERHIKILKLIKKYCKNNNFETDKSHEDPNKNKIDNELTIDRTQISNRVYGNGVYWHKASNKWHSKVLYNYVEYSLGYYNNFNVGKYIYEQALLAIKYNIFESWYENIEEYRITLRSTFTDDSLLEIVEKNVKEVVDKNDTEKLIRKYNDKINHITENVKGKILLYKNKYHETTKKHNKLFIEKTKLQNDIRKLEKTIMLLKQRNYTINDYQSYVFQIPYMNKTYYVTSVKSKEIADELDELFNEHKLQDNFLDWLEEFKANDLKKYIARDVLYQNEHCNTINGYEWFEPRKCWRVKKKYDNKNYSIGYFKDERCCRFILNELKEVIKMGMFEEWYKEIEMHRFRIRKLFDDPIIKTGTRTTADEDSITAKKLPHIRQYKDGIVIGEFYTLKEANQQFSSENKNGYKSIMDCCNGKQKTYKGFQWKYINNR